MGKHGDNGNISAEDLIAANPDAIFMVWYNGYTVNDTDYAGEQVVELITENPAFASLDAVKNGRVFAINLNNVYCSGMRTLDGVLDFAQHLYPELYQYARRARPSRAGAPLIEAGVSMDLKMVCSMAGRHTGLPFWFCWPVCSFPCCGRSLSARWISKWGMYTGSFSIK